MSRHCTSDSIIIIGGGKTDEHWAQGYHRAQTASSRMHSQMSAWKNSGFEEISSKSASEAKFRSAGRASKDGHRFRDQSAHSLIL